jgi:hypothetical protein
MAPCCADSGYRIAGDKPMSPGDQSGHFTFFWCLTGAGPSALDYGASRISKTCVPNFTKATEIAPKARAALQACWTQLAALQDRHAGLVEARMEDHRAAPYREELYHPTRATSDELSSRGCGVGGRTETVATPKVDAFYWTAITFSRTLGTALGDWAADTGGLGYGGGALVFAAGLALIVGLYLRTRVSHVLLFWAAFILTRPLGATVGELLDKPVSDGGLALSRAFGCARSSHDSMHDGAAATGRQLSRGGGYVRLRKAPPGRVAANLPMKATVVVG